MLKDVKNKPEPKYGIYMIPMPIGNVLNPLFHTEKYVEMIHSTKYWVAENARTFRRFISSLNQGINIQSKIIFELNQDFKSIDLFDFLQKNIQDGHIGVVSEAGMPGIADPGNIVTSWAHRHNTKVTTITGPNSIMSALCASGFNGQQFTFHGYAPVKEPLFSQALSNAAKQMETSGYTQIWIETPYRSDRMLEVLCNVSKSESHICVACNIDCEDEWILTKTAAEWKKMAVEIGKKPCVFLIGKTNH